jgi:predicted metal-dependent phosphoesterase TrpH
MGLADLHVHTTASDGMMSPGMLLNYVAVHTALDLVAITDHNTLDGYWRARDFHAQPYNEHLHELEVVPGIEISSRDGHIIGLGVETLIPRALSAVETVAAIHAVGGLALAPHPFAWLPGLRDFAGVGRHFLEVPFDAVEVLNSTPTEFLNNLRVRRLHRQAGRPRAEYGGSDGHFLWALGRAATRYPGRGWRDLATGLRRKATEGVGRVWGVGSLWSYFSDKRRWRRFCAEHNVRIHDL